MIVSQKSNKGKQIDISFVASLIFSAQKLGLKDHM